jgi:hypothetical protein
VRREPEYVELRTGRFRAVLKLVLLLAVVLGGLYGGAAALRSVVGGDDDDRPPGAAARAFDDPRALIDALGDAGIPCRRARRFDPGPGVGSSATTDPLPATRRCTTRGSHLYVLVYQETSHRVNALDSGEVQLGLCRFTDGTGAGVAWRAIVGANWRVATPAAGADLDAVRQALDPKGARERIPCLVD